jgi:uroporphyrinogen decarboxylase
VTSRDRVKATLTFSRPDRVPRDLWALPYISLFRREELDAVLSRFPLDFGTAELSPATGADDMQRLGKVGTYVDEWGSTWHVGEPGVIGEVKEPALADWSMLPTFKLPWEIIRKRDKGRVNASCEKSDKFMLSPVYARPFERLQFLRGTENLYVDLAYDTKEFRTLLDMVHEFYLEQVSWWANSNVDAVSLMDDWGSARSLLIRPDMWQAVFKPLYKDYCDIAHKAEKFVFFHSDGNIEAIYGDLIEVGMDAINSQLFCMDIEGLAKSYKGKVTFWGELDRQRVLPFGTPKEVRESVLRVRRALDDGSGGVIAQCEWGKDGSRANIEAAFEAWL